MAASHAAQPDSAPPSVDWSLFNRESYLSDAREACQELTAEIDAVLQLALPGGAHSVRRATNRLLRLINLIVKTKGFSGADTREQDLKTLFPPGTDLRGVDRAPEALASELFLAVFKEVYPAIRRAAVAYGMPELRRRWGAFHPLHLPSALLDPNEALPDKIVDNLKRFDDYCGFVRFPRQLLGTLLVHCNPARRRVADDRVLLDALLWGLLFGPGAVSFVFQQSLPDDDVAAPLDILFGGTYATLRRAFLSNSKPYKLHLERIASSDEPSAMFMFREPSPLSVFQLYWLSAICRRSEDIDSLSEDSPRRRLYRRMWNFFGELVGAFGYLGRPTRFMEDGKLLEVMKVTRKEKKSNLTDKLSRDGCDFCGRSVEDVKLMRCSRCLVARYCSRECHKEAWKKASEDRAAPHKEVCYNAK